MSEPTAMMGGELGLESSPRVGTTIFVRLPKPRGGVERDSDG